MTFLTYRSNRQSIREKEIEYAKKGKDTTIDSLNEAKEILSELNEEIKGSFRESGEYIKDIRSKRTVFANKVQKFNNFISILIKQLVF